MSGKVSSKIVTDGLVLNLDGANPKSYVSGSTIWNDLTYYRNNGTLTNGPTYNSNNGGSIVFDGIDDYVSCGNSLNFQVNTGTLCTWIKTTNPGSGYRGIITKQYNYGLFLLNGTLITYDWGDGFYGTPRSTDINLSDGKWYYIVLSFTNNNIISPSNNVNIYINGVNVLTTTIKYKDDSQELQIASGGGIGGVQYLNGNISSTQIYSRDLNSSEVLQNYNALKNRFI